MMTMTLMTISSLLAAQITTTCIFVVESFKPVGTIISPLSSSLFLRHVVDQGQQQKRCGVIRTRSSSLLRLHGQQNGLNTEIIDKQQQQQKQQQSPPLPYFSSAGAATENTTPVDTTIAVTQQQLISTTQIVAATAMEEISATSIKESQRKMMDENIYGFNKKLIDTVYDAICFLYPVTGTDRDYARFYVLETVARVPYFAYLSVLHLRETFGERGMGERMRTHYAEADNELHHLLIMESLGGNSNVVDRLFSQTMAFFYYWYVIVIYIWNEPAAYHLSELIEDHAYDTYSKFVTDYEEQLKSNPVPDIARKYYEYDNPFLFDLFCTVKDSKFDEDGNVYHSERRPKLTSLYDVFVNIRDDEKEHWKTLCNLVQYDNMNAVDSSDVRSTTAAVLGTTGGNAGP